MPATQPVTRELRAITVEECLVLLGAKNLGRLAFMRDRLPEVLPVNYLLHEGAVIFRSDYGGKVDELVGAQVAFEIDEVDPRHRSGWSVVVTGRAEEIWQPDELIKIRHLPLRPWAPGEREHWMRIWPGSLTGRRIV